MFSLLNRIGKFAGWSVIVLLGLVFSVWLIFQPNGEVVAFLNTVKKDLRPKAEKIFNDAQPLTYNMLGDWAFIAEIFDDPSAANIDILNQKYKERSNISDALDIDLAFALGDEEREGWRVNAKFLVNPILDQLYFFFGLVDYDLVYFSMDRDGDLHKADVQLRPSKLPRQLLPESGFGSDESIAESLAEYIIRVAIQPSKIGSLISEFTAACEKQLCASDMPRTIPSMSATREGFSLLFLAGAHSMCRAKGAQAQKCAIDEARKAFEMAIDEDEANAIAKFGLGLAALKRAREYVQDGRSEYDIGDQIIEAITALSAAIKSSSALADKIDQRDLGEFLSEEEIRELEISTEFIKSADHYLAARSALQPANYNKAIAEIQKIEKAPKYIQGHIKSIELSAHLYNARSLDEADVFLGELAADKTRKAMGDWLWHYLNGFFGCYWNYSDPEKANKALTLLNKAEQDYLPFGSEDYRESAKLQINGARGYCLAKSGQSEKVKSLIGSYFHPILGDYIDSEDYDTFDFSNMKRNGRYFSFALLVLGEIFVAMDDYDEAVKYLKGAIEIDSGWAEFIGRSPIFAQFRGSEEYSRMQ